MMGRPTRERAKLRDIRITDPWGQPEVLDFVIGATYAELLCFPGHPSNHELGWNVDCAKKADPYHWAASLAVADTRKKVFQAAAERLPKHADIEDEKNLGRRRWEDVYNKAIALRASGQAENTNKLAADLLRSAADALEQRPVKDGPAKGRWLGSTTQATALISWLRRDNQVAVSSHKPAKVFEAWSWPEIRALVDLTKLHELFFEVSNRLAEYDETACAIRNQSNDGGDEYRTIIKENRDPGWSIGAIYIMGFAREVADDLALKIVGEDKSV